MKIARVEAIHLRIPSVYGGPPPPGERQWPLMNMLLVRVETDAGLVGWGEAFGHLACPTTRAALDALVAPLAAGADPLDAGLGGRLARALHSYCGGPVAFALAGLDIALWDLRGQVEGAPLWRLLGGQPAASVPAYASLLRYGDAETAADAAFHAIRRGHRQVKLHEAETTIFAAARAAVGPDVSLMLDVNCRWPAAEGLARIEALKPFAPAWVEEPCWPPDLAVLAGLARDGGIPLAAGENAVSEDFPGLAGAGVAFLQPSVTKIGLTGAATIAAFALERGARLAPHSAYFGPGLAATIHLCAATGATCEWFDCVLEANPGGAALSPKDGRLAVPQSLGIGIAIDEAVVAHYRVA
ncbi:MAG TPA: mandelate racemase/muconate lactonizing enzyme family protein [Hyphomicrobiales bacterium]|nr:mandelate racemase/muconate lactonizing enzyme family protein [Hyphomicrobiales bacterium]